MDWFDFDVACLDGAGGKGGKGGKGEDPTAYCLRRLAELDAAYASLLERGDPDSYAELSYVKEARARYGRGLGT